jgi:hypothetical protein
LTLAEKLSLHGGTPEQQAKGRSSKIFKANVFCNAAFQILFEEQKNSTICLLVSGEKKGKFFLVFRLQEGYLYLVLFQTLPHRAKVAHM